MKVNLFIAVEENNISDEVFNIAFNRYIQTLFLNLRTYIGRNYLNGIKRSDDNQFDHIEIQKLNDVSYNSIHSALMLMEQDYDTINVAGVSLKIKFFTQEIKSHNNDPI